VTYTPAANFTGTVTLRLTTNDPTGLCTAVTADRTITDVHAANAGSDGSTSICDNSVAVIDLFSLITGEQTGGTWTRTTGTGGTFNAGAGTFTPAAGATNSTFTYTITGTAPCPNDASVATVNVTPQGNAGTATPVASCAGSGIVVNLFTQLTGEQTGGTWVRLTGAGGTFDSGAGTFTVSNTATTSLFRYTVGASPCQDTEDLIITVYPVGTCKTTTVVKNSN
jgi:valyl-tRNA synthetase